MKGQNNMEENHLDESAKELLASLEQCKEVCLETVMHSLREGGDYVKIDHIRILLDCSEICGASVNFLMRDSDYAGNIIELCADICEECAESCELFDGHEKMKECATVCRSCAEKCREAITYEEEEELLDERSDEEAE